MTHRFVARRSLDDYVTVFPKDPRSDPQKTRLVLDDEDRLALGGNLFDFFVAGLCRGLIRHRKIDPERRS
jgi:hypothetical protein